MNFLILKMKYYVSRIKIKIIMKLWRIDIIKNPYYYLPERSQGATKIK